MSPIHLLTAHHILWWPVAVAQDIRRAVAAEPVVYSLARPPWLLELFIPQRLVLAALVVLVPLIQIRRAQIQRFLVLTLPQSQQLAVAEGRTLLVLAAMAARVDQAAAAAERQAHRLLEARGHLVKAIRAARGLQQILVAAAAAARLRLGRPVLVKLVATAVQEPLRPLQDRLSPMLAAAAAAQTQTILLELAALAAAAMAAHLPMQPVHRALQIRAVAAAVAATIRLPLMAALAVLALSSYLCPLRSTLAPQPARPPSLHRAATPSSSSLHREHIQPKGGNFVALRQSLRR